MNVSKGEYKTIVGKIIKDKRDEKGLSQDELSKRTKIDRSYISQLERGLKNPTLFVIFQICEVLGTDPECFIADVKKEIEEGRKEDEIS